MEINLVLQKFLNGLSIGSVYAIFALGYTLVYSILGIINLAHGAVFTLGAYLTYALIGGAFGFNGLLANASLPIQLPFAVALILGSALAGLVGVAIERLAFLPLRQRGSDPLLTVVSSLGVGVVIVNLLQYLVGAGKLYISCKHLREFATCYQFWHSRKPDSDSHCSTGDFCYISSDCGNSDSIHQLHKVW
jgi:branched-chain amino acid transport system permease protein